MTSTEDCRKFLAEFFKNNHQIIRAIFQGDDAVTVDTYQEWTEKAKNWKREHKCKPENSEYGFREYSLFTDGTAVSYGCDPAPGVKVPIVNFVSERIFRCDPFEDAVKFVVLEDVDGKLHLGDYVGD